MPAAEWGSSAADHTEGPRFSMFYLPQSFLVTLALRNESQSPETSGKVWSEENLTSVEEDQVKEHWTYTSQRDLMGYTIHGGKGAAQCHCKATLYHL